MSHNEQLARTWFDALRNHDGSLARDALAEAAGLDDFGGGHYVGRDRLMEFADAMPPGTSIEPAHFVQDPDGRRLTCLGHVTLPEWDEVYKVRWSFWIEGGKILQVVNSRVHYLFDIEPNPFDDADPDTWDFA